MTKGYNSISEFRIFDSYHDKEAMHITREEEIRETLNSFLKYGTRVVILESSSAGSLTIGIGEPYGFVQFIGKNNEPPYLVATEFEIENSSSFLEFDSGGTMSPIPMSKCLLFNRVIEIAEYFYKKKELPKFVNWREI